MSKSGPLRLGEKTVFDRSQETERCKKEKQWIAEEQKLKYATNQQHAAHTRRPDLKDISGGSRGNKPSRITL